MQGNVVQQKGSSPPTPQNRRFLTQGSISVPPAPLPTIWWVAVQLTERSVQEEQRRYLVSEIVCYSNCFVPAGLNVVMLTF